MSIFTTITMKRFQKIHFRHAQTILSTSLREHWLMVCIIVNFSLFTFLLTGALPSEKFHSPFSAHYRGRFSGYFCLPHLLSAPIIPSHLHIYTFPNFHINTLTHPLIFTSSHYFIVNRFSIILLLYCCRKALNLRKCTFTRVSPVAARLCWYCGSVLKRKAANKLFPSD